jgi:hypothetical protein
LFQVTGGETNQKLPCHQVKNSINTYNQLIPTKIIFSPFIKKKKKKRKKEKKEKGPL